MTEIFLGRVTFQNGLIDTYPKWRLDFNNVKPKDQMKRQNGLQNRLDSDLLNWNFTNVKQQIEYINFLDLRQLETALEQFEIRHLVTKEDKF